MDATRQQVESLETKRQELEQRRLRVGKIPFLNSEPFYLKLNQPEFDVIELTPRELGRAARSGLVDAGLMSAADYFSLEESFELLGPFGLSAKREVKSVLLFSSRPIEELGGTQIDLTSQSSTSVRLLRILLEHKYGLQDVEYRRSDSTGYGSAQHATAALLLIGDLALRALLEGVAGMPCVYDLAQEWYDWKGTPFTFAVWAIRKTMSEEQKHRFVSCLLASLKSWCNKAAKLSEKFAPEFGGAEFVQEYWAGFDYFLEEPQMASLTEFRRYCREYYSAEF
jgi:chorismate dehydratase